MRTLLKNILILSWVCSVFAEYVCVLSTSDPLIDKQEACSLELYKQWWGAANVLIYTDLRVPKDALVPEVMGDDWDAEDESGPTTEGTNSALQHARDLFQQQENSAPHNYMQIYQDMLDAFVDDDPVYVAPAKVSTETEATVSQSESDPSTPKQSSSPSASLPSTSTVASQEGQVQVDVDAAHSAESDEDWDAEIFGTDIITLTPAKELTSIEQLFRRTGAYADLADKPCAKAVFSGHAGFKSVYNIILPERLFEVLDAHDGLPAIPTYMFACGCRDFKDDTHRFGNSKFCSGAAIFPMTVKIPDGWQLLAGKESGFFSTPHGGYKMIFDQNQDKSCEIISDKMLEYRSEQPSGRNQLDRGGVLDYYDAGDFKKLPIHKRNARKLTPITPAVRPGAAAAQAKRDDQAERRRAYKEKVHARKQQQALDSHK